MKRCKLVIADLFAVDPDSLIDPYQVRRGIQTRLQSRCPQDRGQRRRGRPLAIRSSDQHTRKAALGMIHPLQQHPHMREIEFVRRPLRQLVAERKHTGHRGLVESGQAYVLKVSVMQGLAKSQQLEARS